MVVVVARGEAAAGGGLAPAAWWWWKPERLAAGESLRGSEGGVGRSQGNPPNIIKIKHQPQSFVSLSTFFHI